MQRLVLPNAMISKMKLAVESMQNSEEMDIYEFGVFKGDTLSYTIDVMKEKNIKCNKVRGFDSFLGLPEEKNDVKNPPSWHEGAFTNYIDDETREEIQKLRREKSDPVSLKNLEDKLIEYNVNRVKERIPQDYLNKFDLIVGFFGDVLNDDLVTYGFKKASLVHIDCDNYTSAYQCLDYLFQTKLIGEGTILVYDDWGSHYECDREYGNGESRAHSEITSKYNVKCQLLYKINDPITPIIGNEHEKYSGWRYEAAIFKVISVGI